MNEGYALAVPPEYIQALTHPTLYDKIKQLPVEAFNEYIYSVVEVTLKERGIDLKFTEEEKAASLEQLMQPWEE